MRTAPANSPSRCARYWASERRGSRRHPNRKRAPRSRRCSSAILEGIAGHNAARDWRALPSAIFTDPEVATVGLTETQAKAQGREVKVGKFPYGASGRAMAVFETDGFVKVVVDANDHQVLGMTMVGPEASELIAEGALAMEMCAYAEDVGLTIHTHPTLAEATMEAFKGALGEAVHVMNRR